MSDVLLADLSAPCLATLGADHSQVAQLVQGVIVLLLVATGVTFLSRRLRLPYVTGLVLAGLGLAGFSSQRIGLDSSLIINLFLPILLFESAINTDISRLRSTLKPISLLAGPGVLISAGVTAVGLHYGLRLDWIPATLGGVILAITDTVSVIALFKEVAVPSRLITIVEGESLFNDGIALVLYSLILKFAATGRLDPVEGVKDLLVVMVGGLAVGLALGYLGAGLYVQSADDPLSSILVTVAIALSTFQVGQFLGVSGVVAVVVAGLVVGNLERSERIPASSRITVLNFWEYAGFTVNTFIFLLIGLEINPATLAKTLPAVLLAVLAYQAGRALAVYPLLALARFADRAIPLRWQHVLFLGNIKGSLSMALALSLPTGLPGRETLIAIVFGAVLLSLVVQGVSLPWLVTRLQLTPSNELHNWVENQQSQLMSAKAAQAELDSLLEDGVLPRSVYEELRAGYQVQVVAAERALRDFYNQRERAQSAGSLVAGVRRRLLLAEKSALTEALRKRTLSAAVVKARVGDIDAQLLAVDD
jgi:monovalent cation:H+ antiporter, CPA1 family